MSNNVHSERNHPWGKDRSGISGLGEKQRAAAIAAVGKPQPNARQKLARQYGSLRKQ